MKFPIHSFIYLYHLDSCFPILFDVITLHHHHIIVTIANFLQIQQIGIASPSVFFDILASLSSFLLPGRSCFRIIGYFYIPILCISHSLRSLGMFRGGWYLAVTIWTFIMFIVFGVLLLIALWVKTKIWYLVTFPSVVMFLSIYLSIIRNLECIWI